MLPPEIVPEDLLGPTGFYIEAGANDGVSQSNTLALEGKGWRGLLIEPNEGKLNQCRASRSDQNIFECCALVSFEYEGETIRGNFAEAETDASLVGQITDPSKYWADGHRVAAEEKLAGRQIIKVPVKTLQSILDEHGISTINYLALDVEGYEYDVMDGLDFGKNPPQIIRVETASYQERIDRMIEYLKAKGYQFLGKASINDCVFGAI
jgi:FkbM family methyltransferase